MLCLLSHPLYHPLSQDHCTFACIEASALTAYEPLSPWTLPALVSLPGMGSALDGDSPESAKVLLSSTAPRKQRQIEAALMPLFYSAPLPMHCCHHPPALV